MKKTSSRNKAASWLHKKIPFFNLAGEIKEREREKLIAQHTYFFVIIRHSHLFCLKNYYENFKQLYVKIFWLFVLSFMLFLNCS